MTSVLGCKVSFALRLHCAIGNSEAASSKIVAKSLLLYIKGSSSICGNGAGDHLTGSWSGASSWLATPLYLAEGGGVLSINASTTWSPHSVAASVFGGRS
jgi:hypothetical protein